MSAAFEGGERPLGLLPETKYTAGDVELIPGDIGVLVTDGITEALEPGPMTLSQALGATRASSSPADICDDLLRAAARGSGPAGAPGWEDDRTVLVFAVEPAA